MTHHGRFGNRIRWVQNHRQAFDSDCMNDPLVAEMGGLANALSSNKSMRDLRM